MRTPSWLSAPQRVQCSFPKIERGLTASPQSVWKLCKLCHKLSWCCLLSPVFEEWPCRFRGGHINDGGGVPTRSAPGSSWKKHEKSLLDTLSASPFFSVLTCTAGNLTLCFMDSRVIALTRCMQKEQWDVPLLMILTMALLSGISTTLSSLSVDLNWLVRATWGDPERDCTHHRFSSRRAYQRSGLFTRSSVTWPKIVTAWWWASWSCTPMWQFWLLCPVCPVGVWSVA